LARLTRKERAEGAVELQAQGGDAAGQALLGLLLSQRRLVIVEAVFAQAIERLVDAVWISAPSERFAAPASCEAMAQAGGQFS